jgi:thiamine pyrophosphate-dependent acetolactate synthase large subunit-like protein
VTNREEMTQALNAALAAGKPTLINAITSKETTLVQL